MKPNSHVIPTVDIRINLSDYQRTLDILQCCWLHLPPLSVVYDKPNLIFKYLLHITFKLCCLLVLALV